MAAFPYELFKRGWKRADPMESNDDAMHLPLPVSHSSDTPSVRGGKGNGRQRFRLLDKGRAAKGIVRFGLPAGGWYLYWSDIFHTLLNMPRHRFLLVFFAVYLTEYLIFALLYLTQSDSCVRGVMKFSHAMWFSVQTASTLGYTGNLSPDPDCVSVNVLVLFQVITAALIDYCMMGLVFARFASPNKRSFTIRFSSTAVLFQRPEDGLWCLSFRLANIRKHSLINPQISLMLALPSDGRRRASAAGSSTSAAASASASSGLAHYRFRELPVENLSSQAANLRLGLHAHINHVIRQGSPLFDCSLDELQAIGAEVLCFMEGVDPMTSNNIQARHSYTPADIRMNERFVPIELKLKGGEVGLDFSGFDTTTAKALAEGGADEVREGGFATFLVPVPGPAPGPSAGSSAGGAAPRQLQPGATAAASARDIEADWGAGANNHGSGDGGVPLMPLSSTAVNDDARGGGSANAAEVDTMMAVAMSGDMRSHMQALRAQSIRSLTTPLITLPQLVPSVGGAAMGPAGSAPPMSSSAFSRAAAHPLASPMGSGLAVAGGGGNGHAAAAVPGLAGSAELRDLCDAVLTDVGSSMAVKRQAALLKEALGAMERLPRGPAELAGLQL